MWRMTIFKLFFVLFWFQILNLQASLQNKNTLTGPFPRKRSVLRNPDRERTNQSTRICRRLGLPYNKDNNIKLMKVSRRHNLNTNPKNNLDTIIIANPSVTNRRFRVWLNQTLCYFYQNWVTMHLVCAFWNISDSFTSIPTQKLLVPNPYTLL